MSNRNVSFVKTTVIGGLVVVIPISLIIIILGDLFANLIEMTQPVAKYLPFNDFINTIIVAILAVTIIFLICFITGLIVRTSWGVSGKDWFERSILNRLPMYSMLKNLTQRFMEHEGTQFTPAEIDLFGSDCAVIGVIVEELIDGRISVFVPVTPAATVGQVYLVPAERVKRLDAPLGSMINTITEWGIGAGKLYK